MIKSLNALRAVAAVVIIMYHTWSGTLATEACMAMIMMMALSGMVNAMHQPSSLGYVRWIATRLRRILPLHWLTLAALVTGGAGVGWPLLLNALLLHAWVPSLGVCYGYNTMSWFLSALLPCYLLLPWLCRALCRVPVRAQVAMLAAILVAEGAWLLTLPAGEFATWAAYVAPPVQLVNFAAGVVACNVWRALPPVRVSARMASAIELAVVALVAALAWCTHTGPLPARLGAPYSLCALLMAMVALAALSHSGGVVTSLLSSRLMQWLGGISFEMFMLHGMVCAAVLAAVPRLASLPWGLQAAVCLPVVTAVSWAVNRLLNALIYRAK